jgi:atypical dual specificity phosphatase
VILPKLIIGEYPTPEDAGWLQSAHGVTAVVSLQDDADLASKGLHLASLVAGYRAHGLEFERFAIGDCDTDALRAQLGTVVHVLDGLLRRAERVYLHCNAGMNRAPTVAIAYLHARRGLTLLEARDLVKQRRHCVPYMSVLEAHFREGKSPEEIEGENSR